MAALPADDNRHLGLAFGVRLIVRPDQRPPQLGAWGRASGTTLACDAVSVVAGAIRRTQPTPLTDLAAKIPALLADSLTFLLFEIFGISV